MKAEHKTWYNIAMRILMALMLFPLAALGTTVSELPPSGFADTEVSTNIAFVVDLSIMTRIEFTVALDATPTNNVEVAIGTDENSDGNLSVEEAAYVFGYDCGTWFERSQSKSEYPPSEASCAAGAMRGVEVEQWNPNLHCTTTTPDYGLSSHTFILKTRKLDAAWDTVKVTRRGCGAACELVKAEGRKPGFKLEVR